MSEIRGPFSAIASAIVEPIHNHQRLPPDKKRLAHVSLASHLLGWCLYLCPLFKTGPYLAAVLVGSAMFGNGKMPDAILPLGAWSGLTAIGVLWLLAAWKKAAQGQRDYANIVGRGLLASAFAWLLWNEVYPDWGPIVVLLLKGFYIAWLCSAVVRFLLAAQLFGGRSAFDMVAGNIAASQFNWNGPRRRRRFFFFW